MQKLHEKIFKLLIKELNRVPKKIFSMYNISYSVVISTVYICRHYFSYERLTCSNDKIIPLLSSRYGGVKSKRDRGNLSTVA